MAVDPKIQKIRSGIIGPVNSIPTPFTRTGDIDWNGVRNIIEVGITGGSEVSLLTYGNSQFDFLNDQEVAELTKVLVQQVRGRAVTVASTKRWWTGKVVEFAGYCAGLGVDVLMMIPSDAVNSAENADSINNIVDWYKKASKIIPVMLVGFPRHEILDRLSDEPQICAFKEDGTMEYAVDTLSKYAGRWSFVSGGTYKRHLAQAPFGSKASFSLFSCFAPHVDKEYWNAVKNNNLTEALRVINRYEAPLEELIIKRFQNNWQSVWRAALELNNVASRYLRPPCKSLTDMEMEEVSDALSRIGLLTVGSKKG